MISDRQLRGKFPEVRTNVDQRDNNKIQKRDGEQKEKMKEFADKRRHTASSIIKVGDLALAKQRKNSLTSLSLSMVAIGVKEAMVIEQNSRKTRNYAHWKMLQNGYRDRQVANCNDYDDEDVFDSDTPTVVDTNQEAEEPGEQRNQTKATGVRPTQNKNHV